MDAPRFVRRAPARPLVRLGDDEGARIVAPRLGAHFPATTAKELDFVLDPRRTLPKPRRPE